MPIKKDGRHTPKEIIESVENPNLEECWSKDPREEPVKHSWFRSPTFTVPNMLKSNIFYTFKRDMHTHPTNNKYGYLPSNADLSSFFSSNQKTMIVAQTNPRSGKLKGYYVLRKTKDTPKKSLILSFLEKGFGPYTESEEEISKLGKYHGKKYQEAFERFCKKYHIQHKHISAKQEVSDLEAENDRLDNHSNYRGLEAKHLVASIAMIFSGIMFSTFAITGNVIGATSKSYSLIGIIFFIAGIFYLYSKKPA